MNVRLDDISIEVRRRRRRTADIVIERDGRVMIRVPQRLPEDGIRQLLESKKYWILTNLTEWRELNAGKVLREFKSGEGFLYLGRTYRLQLVPRQRKALMLSGGRFRLKRSLVERGELPAARNAFKDFYITQGLERIRKRVAYFAPKIGTVPNKVDVRELGYRWASCSSHRNVAFHWKCMMAPLTIIDYIVVHELCHLLHLNHSVAFWNEVDKILPSHRERHAWLKKHGAGMDL